MKANFNQGDVRGYIEKKMHAYRNAVLARLNQAGEKFVNMARDSGNYTDRTGNLRSSIGYIITYNGEPLFETFPGDKPDGVTKGKALASAEAKHSGYCLVVVAGMDYAAAVEALENYDVITASSLIIESWLKNALTNLKNKL